MKTAPISAVKASLSEYIDTVRRGDEVVITDRGRPVARLVPVEGGKAREGRHARLVREGILAPPRKRRSGKLRPPPGKKASGVLEALLDERSGGR
jgi:prevent-host-death family protein